eukprot:XP_011681733.1 PREDICTED: histamine H3 receptor-like [Strongylocentrotus purpuratus]
MEGVHASGDNISLDGEQQPYSPASLAIISLIMGVIIAVTIIGNFFVILAYILDPHVRANVGNLLILNLAVTDFMVGVFSLTFNLSWLVKGFWSHGEIICKLWLVLDYTICWVSQITMVLISWDRYCLVSMGLKYKTYQTKKRVGLILVFVWTIISKVRQCGPAKVGMGHKTRNLDEGTIGSPSSASCEVLSSGLHERGEDNIMNAPVAPTETNPAEEGPLKVVDAEKERNESIIYGRALLCNLCSAVGVVVAMQRGVGESRESGRARAGRQLEMGRR